VRGGIVHSCGIGLWGSGRGESAANEKGEKKKQITVGRTLAEGKRKEKRGTKENQSSKSQKMRGVGGLLKRASVVLVERSAHPPSPVAGRKEEVAGGTVQLRGVEARKGEKQRKREGKEL